ncbi:MAG: restriction endonuclease subunit S [Methylotenera sp.]
MAKTINTSQQEKYQLTAGGVMRFVNAALYDDESILIPRKGSLNNIIYESKPFWTVDTMFWSKIDKTLAYPKFLFYQLTEIDYMNLNVGSAVPSLTVPVINAIEISLPPLEEQKAIASVLSSLDDKIDLLHRQNTTLERMAETLFRQWFVEEAQEDWEEKPLDKLVTITSSKRVFYSEYVTSGVPFYRSKEIIELHNSGSTNSELFITVARFNDINDKFGAPQENDILLTSVGTLGIPYKVKKTDRFYFKDGNLTWFKDFTGMPSVIIYCWLKSNIGKEQLDSITIGSTQAALTISGLKQILFKLPPKETIKIAEKN